MKLLKLSIIIPCLNEAAYIQPMLDALQIIRQQGHEIILCDGGSKDTTLIHANNLVDIILSCQPSRARQMNAGAKKATGDILCFLHADTRVPENFSQLILNELQSSKKIWGRFNIQLSNPHLPYKIISWFINIRSCLTGIATGDQGIFIIKKYFQNLHGYKNIPLMEDIEISKRLNKICKPICIKKDVLITSSRRWENSGILQTILLMWNLRLRYFLGTSPVKLAKLYK